MEDEIQLTYGEKCEKLKSNHSKMCISSNTHSKCNISYNNVSKNLKNTLSSFNFSSSRNSDYVNDHNKIIKFALNKSMNSQAHSNVIQDGSLNYGIADDFQNEIKEGLTSEEEEEEHIMLNLKDSAVYHSKKKKKNSDFSRTSSENDLNFNLNPLSSISIISKESEARLEKNIKSEKLSHNSKSELWKATNVKVLLESQHNTFMIHHMAANLENESIIETSTLNALQARHSNTTSASEFDSSSCITTSELNKNYSITPQYSSLTVDYSLLPNSDHSIPSSFSCDQLPSVPKHTAVSTCTHVSQNLCNSWNTSEDNAENISACQKKHVVSCNPSGNSSVYNLQSNIRYKINSSKLESNSENPSCDGDILQVDSNSESNMDRQATDNIISGGSPINAASSPSVSRQQLINSPCPICGDRISGFHYGIFSCESCKGFFKRTVQNKKNYVCLRGACCVVTIATRKKCPACRFERCLQMGMKLEAIREDRTRGGRSTYRCSYAIPSGLSSQVGSLESYLGKPSSPISTTQQTAEINTVYDRENNSLSYVSRHHSTKGDNLHADSSGHLPAEHVPQLLEQIWSVEHLWHSQEQISTVGEYHDNVSLKSIADVRLYKIVKWCKSLPLFHHILIDDQISLLIHAWCKLLLFSCCYHSIPTPGLIRVSQLKSMDLQQARTENVGPFIERMLNFADNLRRLQVDQFEFVALKVIILLTSDSSELKEPDKVRESQEKVLHALQLYTQASKFGELLLTIPELERLCQVGKDMLSVRTKEEDGSSFNLLMELLRGDH